jgi:hypothetical protein
MKPEGTMKFNLTWSEAKKFEEGNFDLNVQGVYLIGYRDTMTDKRYPVYVGQGNVGTRLADHHGNNNCVTKRINQHGRVGYYRYSEVPDEDDRLDIELGLYNNHGGLKLCNEVEPPGSGRYARIEVEEVFP